MFFYVSKLMWFFATPSNLVPGLVLLGLAAAWSKRYRRLGLAISTLATVALFVLGLSPVATLAMHSLERRFAAFVDDGAPVAGAIVLGGALAPDATARLGQPVVNEAGERILAAVALAHRYPDARIILSGGSGRIFAEESTEADATAAALVSLGVPAERLVRENRSRTTYENAAYTGRLIGPVQGERWLLVTSAWHMPRAVGVFRRVGVPVVPYPVDFRTLGDDDLWRPFASVSDGLRRLDVATREWVGLVGYRLTGRTTELLPGP